MDMHEAALHAAQAAQSAALEHRDAIRELLRMHERENTPPRFEAYALNINTAPIEDVPDVDRQLGPVKSTAIINFDAAATIYVGWAGRQPQAASQALKLAPRQLLVVPWIVDRVEISLDAGVALPPPANSIQVAVVRFYSVQPIFGASI